MQAMRDELRATKEQMEQILGTLGVGTKIRTDI
jgi:hypothetical protein